MINIDKGVSIILHDWLNVRKDESIHFITDETHMREAEAFERWAYGADANLKTTILNSQLVQKGDIIESMTDVFCKEDVIIGATDFSFITTNAIRKKRMAALYEIDQNLPIRKSHENPDIQTLYHDFLGEPLSEKAHELLHTAGSQ